MTNNELQLLELLLRKFRDDKSLDQAKREKIESILFDVEFEFECESRNIVTIKKDETKSNWLPGVLSEQLLTEFFKKNKYILPTAYGSLTAEFDIAKLFWDRAWAMSRRALANQDKDPGIREHAITKEFLIEIFETTCERSRVTLDEGLKNEKGEFLNVVFQILKELEFRKRNFDALLIHSDGGVQDFLALYKLGDYYVIIQQFCNGSDNWPFNDLESFCAWLNNHEQKILSLTSKVKAPGIFDLIDDAEPYNVKPPAALDADSPDAT